MSGHFISFHSSPSAFLGREKRIPIGLGSLALPCLASLSIVLRKSELARSLFICVCVCVCVEGAVIHFICVFVIIIIIITPAG